MMWGMFGGMRRAVVSAAVLVVVLGTAACGGDDDKPAAKPDPAMTELKAGMCVAGSIMDGKDVAPDPATVVDCSQGHQWEIYAVSDIDQKFLDGTTKAEKLKRRDELAAVSDLTDLSVEFKQSAWRSCRSVLEEWSGLSKVAGAGSPKTPQFRGASDATWLNVTTPQQWEAGRTQLICSVFFHEKSPQAGTATAVSDWAPRLWKSTTDAPIGSVYLTGDVPVGLRDCDSECTSKHARELLFSFDARAAFGKGFLVGEDPKDAPTPDHQRLLAYCRTALKSIPDHHSGGEVGWYFFNGDLTKAKKLDDDPELFLGCSFKGEGGGQLPAGWNAWGSSAGA